MCELCFGPDYGYCQDCGQRICHDDGTAYITEAGDVLCYVCGPEYDEEDEEDVE